MPTRSISRIRRRRLRTRAQRKRHENAMLYRDRRGASELTREDVRLVARALANPLPRAQMKTMGACDPATLPYPWQRWREVMRKLGKTASSLIPRVAGRRLLRKDFNPAAAMLVSDMGKIQAGMRRKMLLNSIHGACAANPPPSFEDSIISQVRLNEETIARLRSEGPWVDIDTLRLTLEDIRTTDPTP